MQFSAQSQSQNTYRALQHQRLVSARNKVEIGDNSKCKLTIYNSPPTEDITLEEFDRIAFERLNFLRKLENFKEVNAPGTKEFEADIVREIKKYYPSGLSKRADVIGHYILRLAFCRSSENMKWLIQQEVDLFRGRFQNMNAIDVSTFMEENNIHFESVEKEEKEELITQLSSACSISVEQAAGDFFKLDFTQALDLVRRRKVYLHKGMAYVGRSDIAVIMCGILRANMGAAMTRASKQLALIEEEGRILPRLTRLANNAYNGKHYDGKENSDQIKRQDIDSLCGASFPPCMKQIHNNLRLNHHLRHGGRRQYGLFLKAIGLSLDEALLFMREEFTKKIDSDKFDKQYAYNVRHMYGKEGKRIEGVAFPCSSIILNNPPSSIDCHGCPFKHLEQNQLRQRLEREGLAKAQADQILNMSSQFAFDKACTRFFEYSHKMDEGALGQLITHPNQYYELSREVLAGKRAKDNHIVTASQQQQTQNEMEWD